MSPSTGEGPKSPAASSLSICAQCQSLLERPSELATVNSTVECDKTTIIRSASSGCRLCKRFEQMLVTIRSPENLDTLFLSKVLELHLSTLPNWYRVSLSIPDGKVRDETNLQVEPALHDMEQTWLGNRQKRLITTLQARNTGDADCLMRTEEWMINCLRNHRHCNTPINPSLGAATILPGRLISVDAARVHLVETEQVKLMPGFRYGTVSHRWNQHQLTKLTASNLRSFEDTIVLPLLHPVFRDAIFLCQFLRIPFLWIDQLCIVQDDANELGLEISQMGSTYENACLNIGALAAAESDSTAGLFTDRHEFAARYDPVPIRIQRSDFDENCYAFQTPHTALDQKVLMSRGWVLQERLLSSRSVYFGQQLQWECSELIASEYFPDGCINKHDAISWGVLTPYRLKTMLTGNYSSNSSSSPSEAAYDCWNEVVRRFSRCALSNESDYFPALSGLSKYFAHQVDDEYLAGLWRKTLFRQLLWYCNEMIYAKDDNDLCPKAYRAPSWSWASKNFVVEWILSNPYFRPYKNVKHICKIEHATVTLKGADPTGEVSGGYIRMTGPIQKTNAGISRSARQRFNHGSHEWYDGGYDSNGNRKSGDSYHFLMGHIPKRDFVLKNGHIRVDPAEFLGLIIEPVDESSNIYRRIGVFCHPRGTWTVTTTRPIPDTGPCDEFKDFDLDNYERHTVTII